MQKPAASVTQYKLPAFLFVLLPLCLGAQLFRLQQSRPKMGSPFTIMVYHDDSAQALLQMDAAFRLVDSLNMLYSDYDTAALAFRLSQAPANTWIPVPESMMRMLLQCRRAYKLSRGSFDITTGALTHFWRQQRRTGVFPDSETVKKIRAQTGWKYLKLDTGRLLIKKMIPALRLDFGGIAKGAAAQAVVDYLQRQGLASVMADAGGDIACGAPPPGKAGWGVAVNLPDQEDTWPRPLILHHQAVATSGNLYQGWVHNGNTYAHIIHPATGYGTLLKRNVTVLAKDGATADWLATAFSLLPKRRIAPLAKRLQAEYFIAEMKGEKIISCKSPGFPVLQ